MYHFTTWPHVCTKQQTLVVLTAINDCSVIYATQRAVQDKCNQN